MSWIRPSVTGSSPSARCAHATCVFSSQNGKLFVFGGWNGQRMLNDIYVFHMDSMTWVKPVTTGNVPGLRAGHTITSVKTKLFVFGGGDGSHYLNDLHILDTETMTWSNAYVAGTSPAARSRHTATLVGKRLFVFGGGDDTRVYNDLYILDTETMEWTRPEVRGTIPVARWGHTMTLLEDFKLLIFGGHDGTQMLGDLHVLDTNTLVWTQIKSEQQLNSNNNNTNSTTNTIHNAATTSSSTSSPSSSTSSSNTSNITTTKDSINNSLNNSSSSSSIVSNPNASSSSFIAGVAPSARAGHTATALPNKKVLLFGGGDGAKILNDVWLLDTTDYQWSKPTISGNAPSGRCAHSANLIESKLLIYGGGDGGRRFKDLYIIDIEELNNKEESRRSRRKSMKRTKSEPRLEPIRVDIATWLSELGMKHCIEKFITEEITYDILPSLTEQHLIELGVNTIGGRLRIMNAIKALKTEESQPQRVRQEVVELASSVKMLTEGFKGTSQQLSELIRLLSISGDTPRTFNQPQQTTSVSSSIGNNNPINHSSNSHNNNHHHHPISASPPVSNGILHKSLSTNSSTNAGLVIPAFSKTSPSASPVLLHKNSNGNSSQATAINSN